MNHSTAHLTLLSTLALSLMLFACTTVPDVGRSSFNFIPDSQLSQMGLTEFEKIKGTKKLSHNSTQLTALNRVSQRLRRVVPMQDARWEFVLFEDSTPNAFALPGGKVGVNSGIFQVARNDAQLAAVIGHELGHVVAGHSGERMSTGILGSVGAAALGVLLGQGGEFHSGRCHQRCGRHRSGPGHAGVQSWTGTGSRPSGCALHGTWRL